MMRLTIGWLALASTAFAFGECAPAAWQGDLVGEKPRLVVGQNNLDFDLSLDMSRGWGISFIPEVSAELVLSEPYWFFFRTGSSARPTGWYGKPFAPEQTGTRVYLRLGDGWSSQLKPEGWDRIAGVRIAFCPQRGHLPVGAFRLTLRDLRWHAAEPDEVREAKARMPSRVLAYPPVVGERHLAWVNDLLNRQRIDWDPFVRRAAKDGITDLIPLFATDEKAVYRSGVLPTSEKDLAANGDQIELAKSICHRHGVKLHAWKVNWSCFNERSPVVARYRAEGRLARQWKGNGFSESLWLCPSDERNRRLEYDAMLELAGKGVDGIHFDYIRFDGRRTCYCDRCRALFEDRLGRPVARWPMDCAEDDGPLVAQWDAFRRDLVSALVKRVSRDVRARHPGVEISAAVVTSHEICASDWPRWCREKLLDFACPMTYTMSLGQFDQWMDFANRVRTETGTAVYPGIGVFANGSQLDALSCAQQLDRVRKCGFGGVAFFKLCGRTFPVLDLLGKGPLATGKGR